MKPHSDPSGAWELGTLALFLQGKYWSLWDKLSSAGPNTILSFTELHMITDRTVLATVLHFTFSPSPLKVFSLHSTQLYFQRSSRALLFGLWLPCASPQFLFVLKFLIKKITPHLSLKDTPSYDFCLSEPQRTVTLLLELSNAQQNGGQSLTQSKLGSKPVSRVRSVLVNSSLGQDLQQMMLLCAIFKLQSKSVSAMICLWYW